MKKITAFLLAVLLIVTGMFGFSTSTAKAASASFSVSVDRSSAQVGETITVTVTFHTDVQAAANFSLGYDAAVLSPNGSTAGLFENSAESTSQSFSFTVVGAGSTAITASGSGATLGGSPEPLSVASGSASFSSSAAPQPTDPVPTDPPTTAPPTTAPPTPETEPPTPAPTVPTAPEPTPSDSNDDAIAESIAESIRASEAEAESIRNSIAASEAASREESIKAELEGEDTTAEGESTEEDTSGETTEEEVNVLETEQESIAVVALSSMLVDGKATTIDGKSLEMAESLDGVTLPEGYSLSNITLGDRVFEVAKGKNGLILYYLKDGDSGDFYLYDDDENVFYPYVSIQSGSEVYVILKPGKNIKIPGNLKSVDLTIDGKPVSAWQAEDESDPSIYIVFAADSKGQRGFYRYNEKDNSLTAYSAANSDDNSLASTTAPLSKNSSSGNDSLFTILKVLACVIGILLIALIVVIVLRIRSKHSDSEENDSDDDYDDYDDYEDDGLVDFDNPMFSDQVQEPTNNQKPSTKISSDTMDLFDVQDIDLNSSPEVKVSPRQKEDNVSKNKVTDPISTDSMIDMEALSKALSDVKLDDFTSSEKSIGNTQKLEAINRELGEELEHSKEYPSADEDDFDITKFDD